MFNPIARLDFRQQKNPEGSGSGEEPIENTPTQNQGTGLNMAGLFEIMKGRSSECAPILWATHRVMSPVKIESIDSGEDAKPENSQGKPRGFKSTEQQDDLIQALNLKFDRVEFNLHRLMVGIFLG